jgi:hypothetical protein
MHTKRAATVKLSWFLLFIFFIFSCEVGLGSTVDTEAPNITIESPGVASIIRDKFALKGRWGDDGSIASIWVTLKRTDGVSGSWEISGSDVTWDYDENDIQNGDWRAIIDPVAKGLVDGPYQAIVHIKDNNGHKITQSTSFTIDNTPPILILSRPGTTINSTDFDSYGRKITLEGKATDDNDVGLIELSVYKTPECNDEDFLHTYTLKNVPLTVETDAAEYGVVDSEGVNQYDKVYVQADLAEKDANGTANRYFKIKVYDGAERFPVNDSDALEDDDKGNCADYYYTDDGIAEALVAAKKITNLYHIQNGTLETSDPVILDGLENKEETGKFSVNPKNNPTFIVNSRNAFASPYTSLDDPDFQVTNGNSYLEVEVSPGLDKKPIKVSTVAVGLRECNSVGEFIAGSPVIYLISEGHEEAGSYPDVKITKTGTSYKFKTAKQVGKNNYTDLNTGRYYRVVVDGRDTTGNSIEEAGNYSFKLIATNEKIELSGQGVPEYISQDSEAWQGTHAKFNAELVWNGGEPPYYIYRDSETTPITVNTQTAGSWVATEEFTYSKLSSLGFPDSISYRMKKSGDIVSTTAKINLKYDSDKPSISNILFKRKEIINSEVVLKDVYLNNKYYIRNTSDVRYEISGIATDDTGIESVVLDIPGLSPVVFENDSRFKFSDLNLSGISGEVTVTITATDYAGNKIQSTMIIVSDKVAPKSNDEIDASAKNLRIRIGSANNDDITPSDPLWSNDLDRDVGGKYGFGTFGNTTTIQIRGDIEDFENDDEDEMKIGSGLAKIYYKVYPDEHLVPSNESERTAFYENLKNQVMSEPTGIITPLAEKEDKRVFYNVERKKDINGNYVIPSVPNDEHIFPDSTKFTSTPNSKGYYKYYKTVTSTFKDTITGLKEGNNYLVLVVEDNVGNAEVVVSDVEFEGLVQPFVNYSINIDVTPPSDIINRTSTGIIYTNGDDMPLLWGTVSDKSTDAAAAGIDTFTLTRDGVDTVIYANLREVTSSDPADVRALAALDETLRIWEADVTSLLPSESKTISLSATAKDAAGTGNTTPSVVATITVDRQAPVVEMDSEIPSDADSSVDGIQVNGIITLSGTSDDENGIDSVTGLYYKVYTTSALPAVPAANTVIPDSGLNGWYKVSATQSGTTNWKFKNINTQKLNGTDIIADGTKVCFTVGVKDKAGNIGYSAAKPLIINQDTDRPVINFSNLALTYVDEHSQTQKMALATPVWLNRSDLTGTVTDDDGAIEYLKVIAKDITDNSVPTESQWSSAPNKYANGIWSFSFSSDGPKKVYFRVKEADKDGRTGKIFTSNVNSTTFNTYGPKITDVNLVKFGYSDAGSTVDDIVYLKVDTIAPDLEKLYYYTSAEQLSETQILAISSGSWKQVESNLITDKFGGTNRYVYFKYKAFDTNGVAFVTPTFGSETPTHTYGISNSDTRYLESISAFDIHSVESGNTKIQFNIKDNAAASSGSTGINKVYEVIVDNTAPDIIISNHTSGSQVYGSSAVTLRGATSDSNKISKVEYALTRDASDAPHGPSGGWRDITDESNVTYTSKLGWQIVYDDKTTTPDSSSYHAELLRKSLFTLYEVDEGDQAGYDQTEKVYVWLRATDELGNCGTMSDLFYFDVIPNGDKPAIDITYPSNNASVGGTIRITGTTDIQDVSASVKDVYLQIDPSYDPATGFNESGWASELQTLMNAKGVTSYEIKDLTGVIVEGTTTNLGTEIGKGIPSLGNSKLNWYLIINGNKELNEKVGGTNRKLGIRVFAVSSTGKVSKSEVCVCEIDPDAPTFGQEEQWRFVQYTDNTYSTESASRAFEDGVYLTGQWYVVGSVEDDSGIRQITLDDHNIVWTTGTGDSEVVHDDGTGRAIKQNSSPSTGSKFKNYMLRIPVGNTTADSFGKIDYEISVTDGSDSQAGNMRKFTIYYDNKAPEFEVKKGNGKDLVAGGRIYQSNGAYTVQGTFAEASNGTNNQSGFKRIAMFYTRERTVSGVKGLYLIDSMIDSGADGTSNFIKLGSIGNGGAITYETNVSKANGLYWRMVNGTLENSNELTLTDNTYITNKTIRAGGLCMIDNVMYRITRISGNNVILDGTIPDFGTAKPVYFAYAQIIDNLSQESGKTVVYSNTDVITNGDGDCMIEGVQFSGGEYSWNASIDSSNMLDGNVTMSFVGYDAAGNYTECSIAQKISNNAPRIAGVSFGTDIDLDGSIAVNEMTETYSAAFTNVVNVKDGLYYNGQNTDGEWITEYTIPESITVKGAVKLKPMIVGGNTALGWQYTYKTKTGATQSTAVTTYAGVGHSNDGSVRTSDLSINISLKNFLAINIGEGNQNLKFTIWDKTDGSTLGDETSGSAKAEITLPVNIIIADSAAPTAVVSPFYWKNADDNSIYQNNPKNGHIELENELPSSFTTNGSGAGDRDAKVSGKISFDGVATDNVIVEKIKAKIPGYNSGNEFVIAQRDSSATTTAGWTSTNMYYEDEEGNPVTGGDSLLTGASAKPWVFQLISDEYDADGKNIVTFRFHFDTEQISTKAALNVSIQFTAMDKGSPILVDDNTDPDNDGTNKRVSYTNARPSTPGSTSTKTGALTGCYRVDIVPYITKVITNLKSLKSNNPSVYARSAKGHYPVHVDEVLNFEGFNIEGGTVKFTKSDTATTSASYDADAGGTGSGVGGYKIPSDAKSGKVSISVNSIDSLNNTNANDAKGSYNKTVNLTTNPTGVKSIYENYYNRQPNGDNNNLLTDDVVLDIWQFKDAGISQTSGYITEPIMKVNPKSGMLNFAFNSGPANFCMANGFNAAANKQTSYTTWVGNFARFSTCGFTVDENGVTHGITVGLDTNPGDGNNSAGRLQYFNSKWGRSQLDTKGNYEGYNSSRIDNIGAPPNTYNGITFSGYVFIEDRFASPSLTTAVHGSDTYVYLAYYDDLNGQIRFKYGNLSKTTVGTSSTINTNPTGNIGISFEQFADQMKYGVGQKAHTAYDSNNKTEYFSVIAGPDQTAKAGNYLSIDVIKGDTAAGDVIVATWYDASTSKWYYSYKVNPCNDNDMAAEPSATPTAGNWRKPIELKANAGESCQIAVDKVGGIHIASYDSTNADLVYAYLSSYDDTTPQVVTVDSYAFTGTNIRLDTVVSDDGKYIVPYIGYYMSSTQRPKMAYLPGVISSSTTKSIREDVTVKQGVDESEAVTGNWESSIVPTISRYADNYAYSYVNIGLYKDETTGKAKVMSGIDVAYSNKAGLGQENTSKTYGNGTANPVMAYATRVGTRGHLETAQMK